MCTVTFIPLKNNIYITTNRDEDLMRKPASPPESYLLNNRLTIYPKDGKAGGTWVIVCENGNAAVLLNGAFNKHQQKEWYKRSRGLVLIDIMTCDDSLQAFKNYDLNSIEPFTLVILQKKQLFELRWDEQKKHVIELDPKVPYIWSSSTLYDSALQIQLKNHFLNWLNKHPFLGIDDILCFHNKASYEKQVPSSGSDLLQIKTVSTTNIHFNNNEASITYYDNLENKRHIIKMHLDEGVTHNEVVQ
jgi:hypothetical protein